jgi:hypothetical protein
LLTRLNGTDMINSVSRLPVIARTFPSTARPASQHGFVVRLPAFRGADSAPRSASLSATAR